MARCPEGLIGTVERGRNRLTGPIDRVNPRHHQVLATGVGMEAGPTIRNLGLP
jgi:hypothetical protein